MTINVKKVRFYINVNETKVMNQTRNITFGQNLIVENYNIENSV